MGTSCEVVASNWEPRHQPVDAGRSRRCTKTAPHPEAERKEGWIVRLLTNESQGPLSNGERVRAGPERSHRGWCDAEESRVRPRVRLWLWLEGGTTKVFHSISRIKCNTFISSPEIQKRRVHCCYFFVLFKSSMINWTQKWLFNPNYSTEYSVILNSNKESVCNTLLQGKWKIIERNNYFLS